MITSEAAGGIKVSQPAQVRAGRGSVCLCGPAALQALPPPDASASHSFCAPEEDQRRLTAAWAGRWTSGALSGALPVRRRAPGLQPSGVNLSDCQAKYCKSPAITETVKGHMQFPELFTQLEGPPPELPRIGRIKLVERGKVGFLNTLWPPVAAVHKASDGLCKWEKICL